MFKSAGLNFHSGSYDWMVVSGTKAQFRGVGSLNGVEGYRFSITVIDGSGTGGGDGDRFRIRIWTPGGGIVYDNHMGADDHDDPTTVIGGGSIVIHRN